MSKRHLFLILAISLIGGVMGGFLSSKLLIDKQAFAEDSSEKKKVIEAEEFRVVDGFGKVWAKLSTEDPLARTGIERPAHGASLVMYGAKMRESKPGSLSYLRELDEHGRPSPDDKTTLELSTTLYPMVSLLDSRYRSHASLVASYTRPYLRMGIPEGYVVLNGGINPYLTFSDDGKKDRISLRYDGLAIRDENHVTRAILGSTNLTDKTGSTIIKPPSSLVLFDKDGYVVWEAP